MSRDLPPIPTVPLGSQGLKVSALGLGCMPLSGMYGAPDPEESVATFERAIELGITLLDTADSYSGGENERFVGSMLGARRADVVIATKFGLSRREDGSLGVNGRPEHARWSCDQSLLRLGTDHVDLYYLHRFDPDVPIEESIGGMADLVAAGKVRYLGICEALPEAIRRAHAVHPISAMQSEWSLFERGIERDAVPAARALGIGIVPYSPLGRGFLAGAITAANAFAADDRRVTDPRFSDENIDHNLQLVATLHSLAAAKGASPAQLALAWLKRQGDDVVPIPGTERREFLEDNVRALSVVFDERESALLDDVFRVGAVAGNADGIQLRTRR